jgi:cyclopropane-fatty-acyl-phospholipid synthase
MAKCEKALELRDIGHKEPAAPVPSKPIRRKKVE